MAGINDGIQGHLFYGMDLVGTLALTGLLCSDGPCQPRVPSTISQV